VQGPIPNSRQLGAAIRECRKKAGVTIEGLAGRAGMDTSYLSGIEREGRNLSWRKLTSIAGALKVDVSMLVLRAEEIARSGEGSDGGATSP
jgi:transcriptional regulator with XRE-family HTH domain